jgi:lactate dehydrogenase-like 2-hydroxyacid dehydrogenase
MLRIPVLVVIEIATESLKRLDAAGYDLHVANTAAERARIIATVGPTIRAVLTNGSTGLDAQDLAALPALEIVCALGAGHETIDLPALKARGIVATHGPGTNDGSVADHAMALLMSIARDVPQADAAARRGDWSKWRQMRPMISGKNLGIVGLGNIGMQIARRGAGGFDMPVAYYNRRPRDGSPYRYFADLIELAKWSDFMVIATPGGPPTRHLVNAAVLDALGPDGFLINIARGSVVDTAALTASLKNGGIAGAALDVLEGEPDVPADLAQLGNVVLTPHIAGRSPEAIAATAGLVIDNLQAHFSGRDVLTPVRR